MLLLQFVALLVFLSLTVMDAAAQKLPSPTGYVNDFAGLIDPGYETEISRIARSVQQSTGAEITVVSIESYEPYGSIEEYSIALAEAWGIGESGKDNGVMLILSMAERELRIEVGYGLEGALPDGLTGEIMDKSMVPSFQNGNYGEGFLKAVHGISGIIANEYGVELKEVDMRESRGYKRSSGASSGASSLFRFIFIMFILFAGGGRFFWPLLILSGMGGRRGYRGGFGSGGFGSGGFGSGGGGGFSGFSGGSFGGGGASRGF